MVRVHQARAVFLKHLFLFLFLSNSLWATYCGSPLAPQVPEDGFKATREEPFQLRFGYEGDFLIRVPTSKKGNLSGQFQLLNIGGAIERIINVELLWGGSSFNVVLNNSEQLTIYASGLSSYGIRLQSVMKRWGKVVLGANASGIHASSRIRSETLQSVPYNDPSNTLRIKTWQAGVGLARQAEFLSPYIGCKMGRLFGKAGKEKFKAKHCTGMVVGCSILAYAAFVINLEARFIDEQSGTIQAYFGF